MIKLKNVYKRLSERDILRGVDLEIEEGEILALLGPNGAGKTTLISTICGITTPSSGRIRVAGHDVVEDYREARRLIGLVPQELNMNQFDTVLNIVVNQAGYYGIGRRTALEQST